MIKFITNEDIMGLISEENKLYTTELINHTENGTNIEYLFKQGDSIVVRGRLYDYIGLKNYNSGAEEPIFQDITYKGFEKEEKLDIFILDENEEEKENTIESNIYVIIIEEEK